MGGAGFRYCERIFNTPVLFPAVAYEKSPTAVAVGLSSVLADQILPVWYFTSDVSLLFSS